MAEDLLPSDPESVGPYRVIGRLGTGGMGQVYLARSPGGRLVAVKVIRPELAEERGFRARFAREAAAARTVSGMFTAPVVDADTGGRQPWLATVYVPGPSLADAVAERGPLPPGVVLTLAAGLAEALVAIHVAGLVHRDLKPSNVLLAADGPRVIDFGISRAADASMLTQTGMIMGSPGFLSPEQAEGQLVGPPSDVFSLGAVLAFAASGEGPFGTGTAAALVYRVVNREPNLSGVPEQLRPLVERCLVKAPAARPTAGQLLTSLAAGQLESEWLTQPLAAKPAAGLVTRAAASGPAQATLAGPPGPIGQPGPTGQPGRRRSRLRAGLVAAAAVVLAVAVTGIALAVSGPGPGPASPSAGPAASLASTAAASSRPVVDGVWSGTYVCRQGVTGVRLTITGSTGAAVKATADFYPVAGNPAVADGSYELAGSYSAAKGLVLNPDYWINEPPGYEMVGLSAPPPHGNSMSGLVQGASCSTFTVTR